MGGREKEREGEGEVGEGKLKGDRGMRREKRGREESGGERKETLM